MRSRTAQPMLKVFAAALVIISAPATGSPGPGRAQQPDAGRFFLSDGLRIHYSEEGAGPPVVLLHGFAVDSELNWRATGIVSALSGQFRVIALDLRGHGLSDKPRDRRSYGGQMVSDVMNLLDHLDIARAHVVGYSMGSTVALKLATMYPERVISLVLGATGWIQPGTEWVEQLHRRSRALEALNAGQSITDVLRPPGAPRPPPELQAKLDANDPRALAAVSRQLPELWISEQALRANDVPTLAVIGERDELRPTVAAMIGVKPHLQVTVLPERDHINALQDPGFRHAILEFLASPDSAPPPSSGTAPVTQRARPGETVRIVRFNVKPDERESFERFFWESLRPAAARRAGVPVEDLDLGGFRLLIPSKPNPQGYFTYYVLVDPADGALGAGQVMRDMVREAFPGDEGQERVRRWMESMVLAAPFAPVGEDFVEADLRTQRPPKQGRDQVHAGPQKDARMAVEGVLDAWLQAFERGEADVLARLFVEDGMYAANTGQLLRGRAAIENGVRGWIAIRPKFFARVGLDGNSELEVNREVLRFRLLGNGAYSVFRFMVRVKPAGCLMDVGHALAVWRQEDGGWRIESLAVNQDREPPEDACARR